MIKLWMREWRRERRNLLLWQFIWVLLPVLLYVLYSMGRRVFWNMGHALFGLSREIYVFSGFSEPVECGNFRIYLCMLVLVLQVSMVWKACKRMVQSVPGNERDGSIYSLCGQWYSRRQLVVSKYIWILGSAAAGYVLTWVSIIVMARTGTVGEAAVAQTTHSMLCQMGCGLIVLCFMMSMTFLYTVYSRKAQFHTASGISIGLLVAGNLYKIRDLIFWILGEQGISTLKVGKMLSWMDGLYRISPLSWLNPYAEFKPGSMLLYLCICAGLSIVAVALGIWRYDRKELI